MAKAGCSIFCGGEWLSGSNQNGLCQCLDLHHLLIKKTVIFRANLANHSGNRLAHVHSLFNVSTLLSRVIILQLKDLEPHPHPRISRSTVSYEGENSNDDEVDDVGGIHLPQSESPFAGGKYKS